MSTTQLCIAPQKNHDGSHALVLCEKECVQPMCGFEAFDKKGNRYFVDLPNNRSWRRWLDAGLVFNGSKLTFTTGTRDAKPLFGTSVDDKGVEYVGEDGSVHHLSKEYITSSPWMYLPCPSGEGIVTLLVLPPPPPPPRVPPIPRSCCWSDCLHNKQTPIPVRAYCHKCGSMKLAGQMGKNPVGWPEEAPWGKNPYLPTLSIFTVYESV